MNVWSWWGVNVWNVVYQIQGVNYSMNKSFFEILKSYLKSWHVSNLSKFRKYLVKCKNLMWNNISVYHLPSFPINEGILAFEDQCECKLSWAEIFKAKNFRKFTKFLRVYCVEGGRSLKNVLFHKTYMRSKSMEQNFKCEIHVVLIPKSLWALNSAKVYVHKRSCSLIIAIYKIMGTCCIRIPSESFVSI